MKWILPVFLALIISSGFLSEVALAGSQPLSQELSEDETYSDADMERKYLSMLINEIDGLEYLIKKAQLSFDKDERVKFQYQWLRRDLALMKVGINNHINAPRTAPRTVAPLSGDYRQ